MTIWGITDTRYLDDAFKGVGAEKYGDFGDQWLDQERSLVLRIPSIVNPYEWIYLINPLHPEFDKMEIGLPVPVPFDPRLTK